MEKVVVVQDVSTSIANFAQGNIERSFNASECTPDVSVSNHHDVVLFHLVELWGVGDITRIVIRSPIAYLVEADISRLLLTDEFTFGRIVSS